MFHVPRNRKFYKQRRDNTIRGEDYVKLFRFREENVEWIAEHFLGNNDEETRGGALSSVMKMKIMLRYVADPGFQTGVAEVMGVSQPTVSNAVKFVTGKIIDKAPTWIHFPQNANELQTAKEKWQTKYNFPTAIGALDCTHIQIKKIHRNRHGDEYLNRKNVPTINVQATCDANEVFTSVDAQWPGSVHDSRIWKNSSICRSLRLSDNAVLLADSGYGIEKCLMTPFTQPATPEEHAYNVLLKRERVIIERCFGQLKHRFPILENTVRLEIERVPSITVACFVLHNVSKYLQDEDVLEDFQFHPEIAHNNFEDGAEERDPNIVNMRVVGQMKRQELARIIYRY